MKFILFSAFSIVLNLSFAQSNTDEVIRSIREEYQYITQNKDKFKKLEHAIKYEGNYEIMDSGDTVRVEDGSPWGNIEVYSDETGIRLFTISEGQNEGYSSSNTREYYLKDNQIIFVFSSDGCYCPDFEMEDETYKSRDEENRFYYNNTYAVMHLARKIASSNQEEEQKAKANTPHDTLEIGNEASYETQFGKLYLELERNFIIPEKVDTTASIAAIKAQYEDFRKNKNRYSHAEVEVPNPKGKDYWKKVYKYESEGKIVALIIESGNNNPNYQLQQKTEYYLKNNEIYFVYTENMKTSKFTSEVNTKESRSYFGKQQIIRKLSKEYKHGMTDDHNTASQQSKNTTTIQAKNFPYEAYSKVYNKYLKELKVAFPVD